MSRVFFVVNDASERRPKSTTFLLARAAALLGHEVALVSVEGVGWDRDGVVVHGVRVPALEDVDALLAALDGPAEPVRLGAGDVVLIRTNPGRDGERLPLHRTALALLVAAQRQGVDVRNDPATLLATEGKLNALDLPLDIAVPSVVSADRDALRAFVHQSPEACILKPPVGTRGLGVHLVSAHGTPPGGSRLEDALDELLAVGPAIAQTAVPGADAGDVRLVMLEGEPLSLDGRVAAIRRVPADGEFRSNIHLGGRPERAEFDATLQRVARIAGPWLRSRGLWLVGLDVISGRVIEVNVFSTGGLFDAARTQEVDFAAAVIASLAPAG